MDFPASRRISASWSLPIAAQSPSWPNSFLLPGLARSSPLLVHIPPRPTIIVILNRPRRHLPAGRAACLPPASAPCPRSFVSSRFALPRPPIATGKTCTRSHTPTSRGRLHHNTCVIGLCVCLRRPQPPPPNLPCRTYLPIVRGDGQLRRLCLARPSFLKQLEPSAKRRGKKPCCPPGRYWRRRRAIGFYVSLHPLRAP